MSDGKRQKPASGLYFSVKTESVFTIANEGNLLVGNLPVDTVKKIVTNLAKDGFCDLSGFDYQPNAECFAFCIFGHYEVIA